VAYKPLYEDCAKANERLYQKVKAHREKIDIRELIAQKKIVCLLKSQWRIQEIGESFWLIPL